MTNQNETKINQILQQLPSGAVITTKWLHSIGVSLGLLSSYVRSGWFDRIGSGAVIRRGRKMEWQGAIYALQKQLGFTIHPGGKTALGILGSLHYVPLGNEVIYLFLNNKEVLPRWFMELNWVVKFQIIKTDLFTGVNTYGMESYQTGELDIKISSHERAIMEYLYLLESDDTGDEPLRIMENLAWMRPAALQNLLESCNSIKVKRLFLVLAEYVNHSWLEKINLKSIDLGKGKRYFTKNGYLHTKYQITIPRSWIPGEH